MDMFVRIIELVLAVVGVGTLLWAATVYFLKRALGTIIDESIKHQFSKALEDYKSDLKMRTEAARIADFLEVWMRRPIDWPLLNRRSIELALYLPTELYHKLAHCVVEQKIEYKAVVIEIRQYLLGKAAGSLTAEQIIHFMPPPTPRDSAAQTSSLPQ